MPKKLIIIFFVLLWIAPAVAQPGVKYQLNSISFKGNNSFSSSLLSDVIYSQPTPWWFWKFLHSISSSLGSEPVYFDSTNIQIDLSALKDFYYSNGFFESKVSYKYSVDTAGKKVNLTYIIEEGKPFYYGKLLVFGLKSVPQFIYDIFYNDVKLDTTKRFSQSVVQANTSKVINDMLNNGYMQGRLDSTVVLKDTVHYKADVNIYFSPGNRYTIDSIRIQKSGVGAHLVSNKLLRNISGLKDGQFYQLDVLRRSQVRLYRTGLFDNVALTTVDSGITDSSVPVKLQGSIGKMNELSPEFILNNQQSALNIGLGASYIRKNFLGDARKLTVSSSFAAQDIFNVDFGKLIKKFSFRDTTLLGYVDSRITIDQPYLFGKPIFGTWETYAKIDKQSTYNNTVYGSSVTFEFEMPEYTFINQLSTSYTLEQSNENYRTIYDSLSTKLVSDIAADASSTTADNILFPTQGYNLSFHIEEGNSFPQLNSSNAGFYKIQVGGSYYFSLDRKRNSIAAFKLKVGNIQVFYGSFAGVPINRTFYAGGSNSIRGWGSNALVPVGSQVVQGIEGGTSIKGGTFLIEGSAEWRYRFVENMGLALFSDFGNTWLGYTKYTWKGVAVAAGFGFRYYTPIAPFRVDFGFKFYDPSQQKFLWQNWNKVFLRNIAVQFGLGEAF